VKIEIDYEVCSTTGQCVLAAPTVFRIESGRTEYDPEPDESLRSAVEDAVDSCPLQAIRILA
jgi:ferredoxin